MPQFKTVLFGAQFFQFVTKGGGESLDLHGFLVSWTDRLGIRLAHHEYLKRDGGEVEPMGSQQGRWSFRCTIVGPDLAILYRNIESVIKREPRGQLTHPRLGMRNVAVEGMHAGEDPSTAIDVLEFTIDFVENAVDTASVSDLDIGPSVRVRQVLDAVDLAAQAVSAIVSDRVINAIYTAATGGVADLGTMAARYADACEQSAQTGLPDPSLDLQLGRVLEKRDAAIVVLNKVLLATLEPDVSLVEARTAVYVVYAASVQLLAAVRSGQPALVEFVTPTAMPLTVILVRLYGADARNHRQEAYRYNRIPTPYWIPAGTKLTFVSPKVRQ